MEVVKQMSCREARYMLATTLPQPCCAEVVRHLEECAECARFAEEIMQTVSLVRGLNAMEAPASLDERIRREISATPAPSSGKLHQWLESWRVPAPALSPRHALVGLVLMVMILTVVGVALNRMGPAVPVAAPTMAEINMGPSSGMELPQREGTIPVGGFAENRSTQPVGFISEHDLLLHHQNYQLSYPMRTDAGFHMVEQE